MRKSLIAGTLALIVATGAATAPAHAQDTSLEGVGEAYVSGSTLPDSYNPADLVERELKGWEKMSSGDPETSSQGFGETSSTWLLVFAAITVIGQIIQIASRFIPR
ncbi:hypothetical protein [Corynebacterium sp. LK2510]|uniref:hypothetical protein n=1 Tax=Corynebacterium sp. LK2510 TaxID=3110472 RepID=UPI0034CEBF0B